MVHDLDELIQRNQVAAIIKVSIGFARDDFDHADVHVRFGAEREGECFTDASAHLIARMFPFFLRSRADHHPVFRDKCFHMR